VPVVVEVDAPGVDFGKPDATCYVEVGLDWDRDGEFKDEKTEVVYSDRNVELIAKSLSPDGRLTLETKVQDLQLKVPATGSGAAPLRARLVTPEATTWSEHPVEVVLDGSGPEIHTYFPNGHQVESGKDLEVHILAEDHLSRVTAVKAIFETAGTEEVKWEDWTEAEPLDAGTWVAKLSTKGLPTTRHTVLTRAEDIVGNKTDVPDEVEVFIRPKQQQSSTTPPVKKVEPDVTNQVVGQVRYGERGVRAKVELQGAAGAAIAPYITKDDGRFEFTKVPPGAYVLTAESVETVRNYKLRSEKIDVTVSPRPQPPPNITVKVQAR
jgi:hypothetical protein